jgi:hypothetical protein
MSDHRDIFTESRTLTLQATVFRALRDRGLEPELSDTSATSGQPALTFHEQMFRTLTGIDIVAHLQATIGGLDEPERRWVYRVVDAVCRRHERRQRQTLNRRSMATAHEPVALVSTSTATATANAVVFRRRIGGGHG